jgi:hypothetical protein
LAGLILYARREIRTTFTPDSCIESTWIACEVAKQLGVQAEPLAVQTTVFNPAMVAAMEANPNIFDEWQRIGDGDAKKQMDLFGGWIIKIGQNDTPDPGKWNGHLVALLQGHLIDLSLDQAERPTKNITGLKPIFFPFPVTPAFLSGQDELVAQDPNKIRVAYRARRDLSYCNTPAWMKHLVEKRNIVADIVWRIQRSREREKLCS